MADTPNMSLDLPIIGETLGPEYAEKNNTAFETIDSHSHVSGEGVQVPTAGLNINADLPLNGFAVTGANALTLQAVAGTPADLSVYSSGGNLVYRNAAGNPVPITVGDSIAGTPGAIAGLGDGDSSAVFSDLAEDFSWFFDGVNNKHAAFNIGDLRLHPFDGLTAYTNFITLKSPTALASNYSLTLPTTLPASTSFVQVSAAGQLTYSNTIPNGTGAAPSLNFTGSTNTGLYYALDGIIHTLNFSVNGSNRLALRSDYLNPIIPMRSNLAYYDGFQNYRVAVFDSGTVSSTITTGNSQTYTDTVTVVDASLIRRVSGGVLLNSNVFLGQGVSVVGGGTVTVGVSHNGSDFSIRVTNNSGGSITIIQYCFEYARGV
jgi:hypothetical protein